MKKLGLFAILCLALAVPAAALEISQAVTHSVAEPAVELEGVQTASMAQGKPTCFPLQTDFGVTEVSDGARDGNQRAYCQANCWNGSTPSCSGTSCSAQDSNCSAGIRGHVTCNGITTFCPACPTGGGEGCPSGYCQYVFHYGPGCCISPYENEPGYHCPMICQ